MKITREQFEQALIAGRVAAGAGPGARPRYENAISAALSRLGIEVDDSCQCSTTVREYCASNECHGGSRIGDDEMIWVERTWIDVRQGDIVRPVQPPSRRDDETHAAIVEAIGPVNHWHASPNANEYRPNESPLEWSAIRVTLRQLPFMGASPEPFTPEHGMKPDAGVEIKVTRAELAAIEALGGWGNRVGVIKSGN